MMSSVQVHTGEGTRGCPDDETLAVYLEGGLDAQERAALETHMSDCEACLALLAVLGPQLADVPGKVVPLAGSSFPASASGNVAALTPTPPPTPILMVPPTPEPNPVTALRPETPSPPRPRWLLPLVAALVLALGGAALVWQMSRPVVGLETLQAVHVAQRPIVGQLAGFEYAPAPTITRSGTRSDTTTTDLLEAAAAVYEAHQGRGGAESLHAAGVAELVSGGTDAGIALLRRAVDAAPSNVRIVNDAAAALLQRAQMTSDTTAAAEARQLATRATQLDPTFTPAWFNLATAARLADDTAGEQQALARLRALDPQSPWHAELAEQ